MAEALQTDATLGRAHAAEYFRDPRKFSGVGPRTAAYVNAALEELEHQQHDAPGVMRDLVEGGGIGARGLNLQDYHGLREVVQNADDLGAEEVRFALRERGGWRELLIVHDGDPIELPDVLPMTYAFFSTKRANPRKKGRFGVGLKTLSRLSDHIAMHCPPFSFACVEHFMARVESEPKIEGFFSPERLETLFVLKLRAEFDLNAFRSWFAAWTAEDLLFLNTVRRLALHDLLNESEPEARTLSELGPPQTLRIPVGGRSRGVERQRFRADGRTFERFVATVPVKRGVHRMDKATGTHTEMALAVPVDGDGVGRVFLGLPTSMTTGGYLSIDGQFDPATTREELMSSPWNVWLAGLIGELVSAVAVQLAAEACPHMWRSVPVNCQPHSAHPWASQQFATAWAAAAERFGADARLPINGESVSLAELIYEAESIETLLAVGDHERLVDGVALPTAMQDREEVWRKVLDGLGLSRVLELADLAEGCRTGVFDDNQPEWFLKLASRILDRRQEGLLFSCPWLPLSDGGRAQPNARDQGEVLLCMTAPEAPLDLAKDLLLRVDPLVASDDHGISVVRDWLLRHANFVRQADAKAVLSAFASHYADTPLEATPADLLALRDLFERIPEGLASELGLRVGAAVRIEAFEFRADGRQIERISGLRAKPTELYLPASIEDENEGWAKAAGETPKLLWAAPRYSEIFTVTRQERRGPRASQVRGAKRFLMLLGAEVAPRLASQETAITRPAAQLQRDPVSALGWGGGIILNDWVSPDLRKVLADIALQYANTKQRTRRSVARRARMGSAKERGVTLFRCLTSAWPRLYHHREAANLHRDRKNRPHLRRLPATWIAELADASWLSDGSRALRAPYGMVVPTKVTRWVYDEETSFAVGLDEGDASSPLAPALGMLIDPPASDVLKQIEAMRARAGEPDRARLLRLYKALAGHCGGGAVGDLSLGYVRGKFGIDSKRSGLLHEVVAPGATGWVAPTAVYLGRDIFHGRRPFVLADGELAPLWNALNIDAPDLRECVNELKRASTVGSSELPPGFLIDVYRYMERLLPKAARSESRIVAEVPLWCGESWVSVRPVFTSDRPEIAAQLRGVHLWEPPCAADGLVEFARTAGIEPLPVREKAVVQRELDFTTENFRERFQTALAILRDDLAKEDEQSYRAIPDWGVLSRAPVYVTGDGGLHLCVDLPKPATVNIRAHVENLPPAFYFENEAAVENVVDGGRAIAQVFEPSRRRVVALAWVSAWTLAGAGMRASGIELATDSEVDADELATIHEQLSQKPKRRRAAARDGGAAAGAGGAVSAPPPSPPPRKLKSFPDEVTFGARIEPADPNAPQPGPRERKRRPIHDNPPDRNQKDRKTPAPAAARKDYTEQQLQTEGWRYLELALGSDDHPLIDYQRVPGLGADGAINWKKFVEMKAHGRELPASESLTPSEFDRARKEGDRFFLAVVTGIEEGFKTEVRVFSNPLATLPWTPTSSVSVSGLKSARRLVIDVDGRIDVESGEQGGQQGRS